MTAKLCFRCQTTKPLVEFVVDKRRPNGHGYLCLECNRKRNAKYFSTPEGKRRSVIGARRHHERHPVQTVAKGLVRKAIARGDLVRPLTCEECGTIPPPTRSGRPSVQAHHPDYSQPLSVVWVCAVCHAQLHRREEAAQRARK